MEIFCTERFKNEFYKLLKKKQYRTLENDLLEYLFDKSVDQLKTGTNLNNSAETPYIKTRLNGSGGFRVYYLLVIKNEKIYLMFVHPKTGPYGASNIKDDSKAMLYKDILERIKKSDLYTLKKEDNRIVFSK